MKRFLLWCLLSALGVAQPRYLAVLCYHQIHTQADTEMVTTPARFREQLDFLQQQGYQTVTLAEARAFVCGKSKIARPLLITFDDGYDGVYRYAYPELKKHKMRAVVFLVVSQVDRLKPTAHLTRPQLREMADSGVFEFGSHTYDLHVPIPERHQAGLVSAAGIRRDLIRSREVLQGWLNRPVRALAWPYGHYDDACLKLAQQSGFQLVFTTDYGYNLPGCGPWRICRIRLSSVFDTVEVLRSKLATGG
ncbi:MAG: polysaccharide deacetylase family protein [Vulcanimicrobiota bacterium]